MKTYFTLFLIAASTSLVLTPLLRRFCDRFGFLDEPKDDRRVHEKPIPRLGGIAIFLSVAIATATLPFLNNVLTHSLRPELKQILVVLGCGLLVLLLGIFDDVRGANAKVKFVGLGLIAVLFYILGGRIEGLSMPFVGSIALGPAIGFLLTLVWIVGIANAFNLIDGIDGLASGSALFASLVLLTVSLIQGNVMVAVVALSLSGALAGFLRYNFNPASIFLGDSGSLFVGFSLAALSIQGAQKASTAVAIAIPLLAFGLPVVDTAVAIARRLVSGKSILQGDREHIHHMLLERGWSQRRVVLVLYGVCALFGLSAMLFVNSTNSTTAVVLFVVGTAVAMALGRLRYHEVDELRASFKRNIGDRRARATNNLRLRRASRSVAGATTIDQLFNGVLEVLELGEFAAADVRLTFNGQPSVREKILIEANGIKRNIKIDQDQITWSWQADNSQYPDIHLSNEFWTLRMPISNSSRLLGQMDLYRPFNGGPLRFDVNYLAEVFQPAMAQGAERIFAVAEPAPKHLTVAAK